MLEPEAGTEVLAAYAHAAYAQGEFGRARRGASKANRRELRTAVGDAAEAIIEEGVEDGAPEDACADDQDVRIRGQGASQWSGDSPRRERGA